jgi:hypothetical protein
MKKHIYTVIAFAVFAASAFANEATELDVKVPFAFKAGTSELPAGTYRVTQANSTYLLIRGDKGGAFVPKAAVVVDLDSGKPTLKFKRAGDSYVLRAGESEK